MLKLSFIFGASAIVATGADGDPGESRGARAAGDAATTASWRVARPGSRR
jgi:hypothetical protein